MKLKAKALEAIFRQEIPSGVVDGVNAVFTLSLKPNSNAAVMVFLNGLILVQGTHYTISSQTITMAAAPSLGQVVYVFYVEGKQ